LAVDFGERRVGVALSVAETGLAVPFAVIERRSDRQVIERLAAIADEEGIGGLVVGNPVGLDGRAGTASERVHRFAAKLVQRTGLPLLWIDETLTSVEASRRLRAAGSSPARCRQWLDAVAAQILLEEALAARALRRVPPGSSAPLASTTEKSVR
jgi:putative Holliday junction resolvase